MRDVEASIPSERVRLLPRGSQPNAGGGRELDEHAARSRVAMHRCVVQIKAEAAITFQTSQTAPAERDHSMR